MINAVLSIFRSLSVRASEQLLASSSLPNSNHYVIIRTGSFFEPSEKNSRPRKLKPQENNSKLKQKTQGFGKILKNNYKL